MMMTMVTMMASIERWLGVMFLNQGELVVHWQWLNIIYSQKYLNTEQQ